MASELKPFGFAPGSYMNNCKSCSQSFMGDKRAWNCEPCAKALSLQTATPVTPVSPDTTSKCGELVTVLWGNARSLSQPHDPIVWERICASHPRPYYTVELVTRSQAEALLREARGAAEELLVEKELEIIRLKRLSEQTWENCFFDLRGLDYRVVVSLTDNDGKLIELGELNEGERVLISDQGIDAKGLAVVSCERYEKLEADNAEKDAEIEQLKSDLETYQEPVIQAVDEKVDLEFKVADLEADNAALTARVEELEQRSCDNGFCNTDHWYDQAEALEAKLAAAELALETKSAANEALSKSVVESIDTEKRLREALTEIASFTQTTDLLWWQQRARAALL